MYTNSFKILSQICPLVYGYGKFSIKNLFSSKWWGFVEQSSYWLDTLSILWGIRRNYLTESNSNYSTLCLQRDIGTFLLIKTPLQASKRHIWVLWGQALHAGRYAKNVKISISRRNLFPQKTFIPTDSEG